jgi:mono/diheme cytochrome c family protein
MQPMRTRYPIVLLAIITSFFFVLFIATSVNASNYDQADELEHGKYIAAIAGCIDCHTPFKEEFQDPAAMTLDQLKLFSFNLGATQDLENKLLAGGRPFDLGPAGILLTRNLTPDPESGLGSWNDDQIKLAIKTGIDNNGKLLFPVMPYHVYNTMADADLDALVAYLRSIKAVNNTIPKSKISTEGLPVPSYETGIIAPDPSDKAARGAYLVNSVMGCTDCHTPVDPATGAPRPDKYLAGRQPYEGPWGIVYGGNITPDRETGIGTWTEEEITRAITTGVRKDGRRLIFMPWFNYVALKPEDAEAIVYYLKNVLPAVRNEIPVHSLNEGFEEMATEAQNPSPVRNIATSPLILAVVGLAVILVVSFIANYFRNKSA